MWTWRWGPCGQYISKRDEGCGRGQPFGALGSHDYDHKIFKALPRCKRLGWGHSALLGLVLVIDLLELPTIDAQAPLGQHIASHALEQALGAPLLSVWLVLCLTSIIGQRFADLKDRLG